MIDNEENKFSGYKIKSLRVKHQLTLIEAAEEFDITASYLSQIENGKKNPSKKIIRKAVKLFGVEESVFYEQPDVLDALRKITSKTELDELEHAFKMILNERK